MLDRLKFIKRNWAISLILCFYAYLAAHALSGSQGLMKWVDYEDDIRISQLKLQELSLERSALELRSRQMQVTGLDTEILDARSREKLFVSHPKDYIIFLDQTP